MTGPLTVTLLTLGTQQIDLRGHELTHCNMREVWRRLKDTAEVEGRLRQVDAFNQVGTSFIKTEGSVSIMNLSPS